MSEKNQLETFPNPEPARDYEIKIETESENNDKILTTKSFSIIDLKKMQYNYYYHILSNCINNH